jgi:hypothetical protein
MYNKKELKDLLNQFLGNLKFSKLEEVKRGRGKNVVFEANYLGDVDFLIGTHEFERQIFSLEIIYDQIKEIQIKYVYGKPVLITVEMKKNAVMNHK